MKTTKHIFDHNRKWASALQEGDAEYFKRLAVSQSPEFLWIGCADSRVPASLITGLEPGEVFVHRNIANIVSTSDMNCMSVMQYAIEHLKVKHIIICGHYGCGGVKASLSEPDHGLVDYWLEPIRKLAGVHRNELAEYAEEEERVNRLCELNVCQQVENVSNSPIVQRAWSRNQSIEIHGWIYELKNGLINDLDCGCGLPASPAQ